MHEPSSTPPEHARHDGLLVARFAAADDLSDDERNEAARLVAACAGCAELAGDLGVIARAVAREPMPPRRRDFRITHEQTDRLRGTWLQRFLRRFTLPDAALLRPAAAGVMSLGLLLAVAGSVLPGSGGSAETLRDGSTAPMAVENAASQPPGHEMGDLAAGSSTKVDPASEVGIDTSGEADAIDAEMGTSTLQMTADDAAAASPMSLRALESAAMIESAPGEDVGEDVGIDERAAIERAARVSEGDPVATVTESSGTDLGALLVVVGVTIALGGMLVLLFTLLARRIAADPLIR